MRKLILTLLLSIFPLCASARGAVADTIGIDIKSLSSLIYTRPEYCLKVVNEIDSLGLDTPFNCEKMRMNCYNYLCRYEEMIASGEKCLELCDKYAQDPEKATIDILQSLSICCSHANFFDYSIQYAERCIDYCEKVGGYYVTVGYLRLSIAQTLYNMGYSDNAIEKAIEGYKISQKSSCEYDENHRYSYQTAILSFIIKILYEKGDYETALKYALESRDKIEMIGEQREMPSVIFNQMLCNIEIVTSYLYILVGRPDMANAIFPATEIYQYPYNKSIRQSLLKYYKASGDFYSVRDIAKEDIDNDIKRGDTLSSSFISSWEALSEAFNVLGDNKQAFLAERKVLSLKDNENKKILQNNALELSIIYNVQEKEKTILRQNSALKLYVAIIAGILLISALFIFMWFKTRSRNKKMVQQIRQLQFMHGENIGQAEESGEDPRLKKIYEATLDVIDRKERYLSTLNLDQWCLEIGYNRNLVSKAMHYYRHTTLTKYITQLRLIRASELLSGTDLSIEMVAEKSGFGGLATLVRNFKQVYGMTPAEYRKMSISG